MKNIIEETFDVLQTAGDAVENIMDITGELNKAKLTIDICPDNMSFEEKARTYGGRFLKLGVKKFYYLPSAPSLLFRFLLLSLERAMCHLFCHY